MTSPNSAVPMVSVICPVYNDEKRVVLLTESLLRQTYPRDRFEVILVDNGSTDATKDMIKKLKVRLEEENTIQSSYAARNKGIAAAQGEIFAFIDSDCIAETDWIAQGVAALKSANADLAGGKVSFIFSEKPAAAEIFDALTSMQNEIGIKQQGTSTTANLFVKRTVFDRIGLFPEVKSGGDVQWTGMASKRGHTIIFAPNAIVRHPTRNLGELLKKSLRVGKGYPQIWNNQKYSFATRLNITVRKFLPSKMNSVMRMIRDRSPGKGFEDKILAIWFVAWLSSVTTGIGILLGSMNNPKRKSD